MKKGTSKGTKHAQISTKELVYNFLVNYIRENSYPPSIREICAGTYLGSTSSVYAYLQKLEDEGRIEMKRGYSPRAIKLVGYKLVKVEGWINGNF